MRKLALASLGRFCSNMDTAVIDAQVLGPPDIEEKVGLTGGHIFQGECLPQYMWSNRLSARTPMQGVYLCGACTHPGGSVIGINGRNAAMAVLKDMEQQIVLVIRGNCRYAARKAPCRRKHPHLRSQARTWYRRPRPLLCRQWAEPALDRDRRRRRAKHDHRLDICLPLFFVPLAASVLELSSRYPQEGGLYVWTQRAFGDFSGFIAAWTYWMSNLPYFPAVLYFGAGSALFAMGKRGEHLTNKRPTYMLFALGWLGADHAAEHRRPEAGQVAEQLLFAGYMDSHRCIAGAGGGLCQHLWFGDTVFLPSIWFPMLI